MATATRSRVCILSEEHDLQNVVEGAFSSLEAEIVTEQDLDRTDRLDCLVCIADDGGAPELKARWLRLVNRAHHDILLTTSGRRIVPAQVSVWIRDRESIPDQIDRALGRLGSEQHEGSGTIPRLIEMPDEIAGDPISDSPMSLYGYLANPEHSVIGVRTALLQALSKKRAESREEYDVARFVRWSQDRLDRSFVRLTMRLAGDDATGGGVSTDVISLGHILSDSRSSNLVLIKGAPGAGKSLQLRFLETTLALESIRHGSSPDCPLPYCVALGEHATSRAENPLDWLDARWARRVAVDRMQPFRRNLELGNMRLFLDGFNEIPFASQDDRRDWMLRWRNLIHEVLLQNPSNAVVLACRARDLAIPIATRESPGTIAEMLPLEDEDILEIAERRNPRAAQELREAFEQDPTLADLYRSPFTLSGFLDDDEPGVPRSQSEIFVRRIRSALARERDCLNVRLFDPRWLPEETVNLVLDDISPSTGPGAFELLSALPLITALGRLAHDLTQAGVSGARSHSAALTLRQAREKMHEYLALKDDQASYYAIVAAVDLDLLHINEAVVSFRHQSLQEFFAANTVSPTELAAAIALTSADFEPKLGALELVLKQLGPGDELPVLPSTGFEEVVAKAYEMRPEIVRDLAVSNPWLAAEVLSSHPGRGSHEDRDIVSRALRERLDEAADVRERVATLSAMGRIAPNHSEARPALVEIPEGRWELGGDAALRQALGSTRRRRIVDLEAFSIGMYAISNAEYASFMDAGGYTDPQFWTVEGWQWRSGKLPLTGAVGRWQRRRDAVAERATLPTQLLRDGHVSLVEAAAIVRFTHMTNNEIEEIISARSQREIDAPAFWCEERFSNPLQPVVGVSWYEAQAYCAWLSNREGIDYRLPTEDEWEAAALYVLTNEAAASDAPRPQLSSNDIRPPDDWRQVWGNTAELQLGRPSPSGAFASRRFPALPCDLFGNVFEWTTEVFRPAEESRRVCKGGSWRHLMRRAMPGYRGRGDLATRNDDDGFRIITVAQGESYDT